MANRTEAKTRLFGALVVESPKGINAAITNFSMTCMEIYDTLIRAQRKTEKTMVSIIPILCRITRRVTGSHEFDVLLLDMVVSENYELALTVIRTIEACDAVIVWASVYYDLLASSKSEVVRDVFQAKFLPTIKRGRGTVMRTQKPVRW